jgi:hypothetical protein
VYAFLLTDKRVYLEKAMLLIARLAELYPYQIGTRGDGTMAEHMHWGEHSNSESPFLVSFFTAYDLLFDAIDPELEQLLQDVLSGIPAPDGTKRVAQFQLQPVMEEMTQYAIQACEEARYTAADWKLRWLEAEMILATSTEKPILWKKLLFEEPHSLQSTVYNSFYRDGRYHYDSTYYLQYLTTEFLSMIYLLQRLCQQTSFLQQYELEDAASLPLNTMVRYLFSIDTGPLFATFGDTTREINNQAPISPERKAGLPYYDSRMELVCHIVPEMTSWFKTYLEPMKRNQLNQLRMDKGTFLTLAFGDPDLIPENNTAEQALCSNLVEDSATVYLRCGSNYATRHDLVLWGQPTAPHQHGDKLGLWFGGRGCHLASSGGNYPYTWVSPKIHSWETHSAACWTVVVDGKSQQHSHSVLEQYYDGQAFQMAVMHNNEAYPGSTYRRLVWLIPAETEGDAYAIDIFQVSHGKTFDYNTRGTDAGSFDTIPFEWESNDDSSWTQQPGSLAGENVELYSKPGYGWMKDVHKRSVSGDFSFIYRYDNAGLKFHGFNYGKHRMLLVAMGEKGGFEEGNSPWDPHVLWRDSNTDATNHATQFVAVLESIAETPFLQTIIPMVCSSSPSTEGYHPVGLEIVYPTGIKDIFLGNVQSYTSMEFSDSTGKLWKSDATTVFIRLDSTHKVKHIECYEGTYLDTPTKHYTIPKPVTGTIQQVDYLSPRLTITLDDYLSETISSMEGRMAQCTTADKLRTSFYKVEHPVGEDNSITFNVDYRLIHGMKATPFQKNTKAWIDHEEAYTHEIGGEKYIVDIKPGDRFYLPSVLIIQN